MSATGISNDCRHSVTVRMHCISTTDARNEPIRFLMIMVEDVLHTYIQIHNLKQIS